MLGKTRRIKPASTKYKCREVVSEQDGSERDVGFAAGGLWRQLSRGQGQFPCSSLFLHFHRDKLETMELLGLGRKQSILSKEKNKLIEFTFVFRKKVLP